MKKSKIILIILAVIAAIPVVIIGIILSFVTGSENYQKEQDKYFEKVEYYFCGKMVSYKLLENVTCLIEIDVDSVSFIKNDISGEDDFVGLYSEKQKKIFFNGYFETDNRTDKRVISDTLPYVKVNSNKRTIEYIFRDKTIISEKLRFFFMYRNKKYLKNKETKDMVRF